MISGLRTTRASNSQPVRLLVSSPSLGPDSAWQAEEIFTIPLNNGNSLWAKDAASRAQLDAPFLGIQGIPHVLRGWNPEGGVKLHDVTLDDVRVRNVPTNIRDWQGGADEFGNLDIVP